MTEQEQNLAIAEFCGVELTGWYCPKCRVQVSPEEVTFYQEHDNRSGGCGEGVTARPLPEYVHDLNAVYEAEEHLQSPYSVYVATLEHVCGSAGDNALAWPYIHATAAQRCEALLKTIGKWKD